MPGVANATTIAMRGTVLMDLIGYRGRGLKADEAQQQQESQYTATARSNADSAKRQVLLF